MQCIFKKFKFNELINRIRLETDNNVTDITQELTTKKHIPMTSSLKLIQELSYTTHNTLFTRKQQKFNIEKKKLFVTAMTPSCSIMPS